jgi:chromate transporter
VSAAVVGLLAMALYSPVWTSAVHSTSDFAIASVGFVLLTRWTMHQTTEADTVRE